MRKCILPYDLHGYCLLSGYHASVFTTKGKCLGHLKEQHAVIQYKCNKCRKLFQKNNNPHICRAGREDYIPFVMATGEKNEAAAVLDKFMIWAESYLMRHTEKNLKILWVGGNPLLDHLLVNSLTLSRGRGLNLLCHIMENTDVCLNLPNLPLLLIEPLYQQPLVRVPLPFRQCQASPLLPTTTSLYKDSVKRQF